MRCTMCNVKLKFVKLHVCDLNICYAIHLYGATHGSAFLQLVTAMESCRCFLVYYETFIHQKW